MPKNRKAWCSWNSSMSKDNIRKNIGYILVKSTAKLKNRYRDIFLTINPFREIPEDKIFKKVKFTHPYYDKAALSNQNNLKKIQNKKNILFCWKLFWLRFS